MAESPTEKRIRELEKSIVGIETTLKHLRDDVDKDGREGKDTAKALADVQKEVVAFKTDLAEHKERFKTKEAWSRGLVRRHSSPCSRRRWR